ncbi:MAG: PspC domain-containing protein, partial [Frankia sp.]
MIAPWTSTSIREDPEAESQGPPPGHTRCATLRRPRTLDVVQTTDPSGGWAPPPPPPPESSTSSPAPETPGSGTPASGTPAPDAGPRRILRRSRTDRVGAGVAGGLGEYFGVDPVLFRVLFATAAFFGGVGVMAYLLAWAVIPEQATRHAAIDRWIGELRRRRVPLWFVIALGGLLAWGIGFS